VTKITKYLVHVERHIQVFSLTIFAIQRQ